MIPKNENPSHRIIVLACITSALLPIPARDTQSTLLTFTPCPLHHSLSQRPFKSQNTMKQFQ